MTSNHRHVMRVLLALLCAGVLGLTAAVLWVIYNHPFTVLIFGCPRLTSRRRKALLRILQPLETLVARAFDFSPAISPPKSRAVRRAK
jgi:hypothetical protein